jgi:hypothetical protein
MTFSSKIEIIALEVPIDVPIVVTGIGRCYGSLHVQQPEFLIYLSK